MRKEKEKKSKKSKEIVTIIDLRGDKPLASAMSCNQKPLSISRACTKGYSKELKQINEFLFSSRLFLKSPNVLAFFYFRHY